MAALKIIAYTTPSAGNKDGGPSLPSLAKMNTTELPFEVQFNPESITVLASKKLSNKSAINQSTDSIEFIRNVPKTYQFSLFMDGTGASGKGKWDLGAKVAEFMKLCYYQGTKENSTSFLSISWGNFLIYCILESVTVTYKMFDPQGLPIRATLACNFVEYFAGEELGLAQTDWNSAEAKNIDLGNPNKAIAAAKANGSNGLRGPANGPNQN